MDIKELEQLGAFVPPGTTKETIEWLRDTDDGGTEVVTSEVHVVRLGYGDYERLFLRPSHNVDGADEPGERSINAQLIEIGIRLGEQGDQRLTYDLAYRLTPALGAAMVGAIHKVNTFRKKKINSDGRNLARAGDARDRGQDDSRSEAADDSERVSGLGGIHPPARDAQCAEEAGVGLCDAGDDGQ